MKRTMVLGLTGPTGAGKSTVADCFSRHGCRIVDCDRISRTVTDTCPDCLAALQGAFGEEILDPQGKLRRKILAQKAFASPEGTAALNRITHPFILRRLEAELTEAQGRYPVVVIDAPLLFEAGVERYCDWIIAVVAPYGERLRRVMRRDGISEDLAVLRMKNQHSDAFYIERADAVIDGTAGDTEQQVLAILKKATGDLV